MPKTKIASTDNVTPPAEPTSKRAGRKPTLLPASLTAPIRRRSRATAGADAAEGPSDSHIGSPRQRLQTAKAKAEARARGLTPGVSHSTGAAGTPLLDDPMSGVPQEVAVVEAGASILAPKSKATATRQRKNLDGRKSDEAQVSDVVEAGAAIRSAVSMARAPRQRKIPKTRDPASPGAPLKSGAGSELDGPGGNETPQDIAVETDPPVPDPRFASERVQQILVEYRMRRRCWQAEQKLLLQAQAYIRSNLGCEKDAAPKILKDILDATKDARRLYMLALISDKREAEQYQFQYSLKIAVAAEDLGQTEGLIVGIMPFIAAMYPFQKEGTQREKILSAAAQRLPVYGWVKGVRGLSDLGLAKIIGEAGDIGAYRTVAGLWKRLGVAVIDGQRQRKVGDAEAALVHGYSPQRRSMLWNIGGPIIGGMGRGPRPGADEDWQNNPAYSPYQKLFIERLIHEATRDPEAHARPVTKDGKMSFSKHAAARAKRHVEKRLIRDLYAAWRAADRTEEDTASG